MGSTNRASYWYYQTGAKARPSVKACSLTNNTLLMTGFQFPCQIRTFQKHCNRIIREGDSVWDLSAQNLCAFQFKPAFKCCYPREENCWNKLRCSHCKAEPNRETFLEEESSWGSPLQKLPHPTKTSAPTRTNWEHRQSVKSARGGTLCLICELWKW